MRVFNAVLSGSGWETWFRNLLDADQRFRRRKKLFLQLQYILVNERLGADIVGQRRPSRNGPCHER